MTTAHPIPTSLRTTATETKYQEAKAAGTLRDLIDIPPVFTFKYWHVVPNDYPSDLVYKVHDLLIPIRKFADEDDMTLAEETEKKWILKEIGNHYTKREINFDKARSVKDRYHEHLVVLLTRREMGE